MKIENQSLFESFAESANVAVIIINEDQLVEYWNNTATQMFGYSQSNAIGKSISELIIPDSVMSNERHLEYVRRFFSGRPSRTFGSEANLEAKTARGEKISVEITVFKLQYNNKPFVGGLIRNISEKTQQLKDLSTKNNEINNILGQLERANAELIIQKNVAEFDKKRAQTQDKLALSMLFSVVSIVVIVIGTTTFTRVQESVVNFSKDVALLLIGNLGGAVSALYGIKKFNSEEGPSSDTSHLQYPAPTVVTKDETKPK